jgi:hypothetical protein
LTFDAARMSPIGGREREREFGHGLRARLERARESARLRALGGPETHEEPAADPAREAGPDESGGTAES